MDPSGRIPKVPLPEDLPNPERWRYIPEGRIMPGNIFQRLFVSSFVSPQFFFREDVGFGGGIAITDIDFREQRRREFLGAFLTYTTEGQERYRLVWRRWLHHREIPEGGVAVEERSFVAASGGYQRTLTRRFFGLGPDTPERAESSFTDEDGRRGRARRSRAAGARRQLDRDRRHSRRAPQPRAGARVRGPQHGPGVPRALRGGRRPERGLSHRRFPVRHA